jgi:4-hydroxy-3-methylbut-2-en-1-yl diphosphate synthase IspG/GcpE
MEAPARLLAEASRRLAQHPSSLQVAVNGILVNGAGESERCDVVLLSGRGRAIIMVRGEIIANVAEQDAIERLMYEVRTLEDST